MLVIALVLALIGLVALVFAVVTSNELVAWVCIGASVLGVMLLIIDALRERQRHDTGDEVPGAGPEAAVAAQDQEDQAAVEYPEEVSDEGSPEVTEGSAVPADGGADEAAK